MPGRPTLVLCDDRSPGAHDARAWILSHPWTGWDAVTMLVRADAPGGAPEADPEPLVGAAFDRATAGVLVGDPRRVLAARHEDDLLVVGARGTARHQVAHLGKVPEHLAHAAREPLVVARRPVHGGPVLVCVDGSAHAGAAVDAVTGLPWLAGTRAIVLSIDSGDRSLVPVAERTGEHLARAGADVEVLVVVPDELDLTVNPRWSILDTVARTNADLVALGTRGVAGLERFWIGSVASAVLRHAPCSVLVARDGQRHESHVDD